ncbi:MAG: hypothetical protein LBQ76_09435 [Candidatus Fibromonas sp.]|jgi:hypothetical protein|nr:hypothetical protein [Candidatus Fibromonas sp.]
MVRLVFIAALLLISCGKDSKDGKGTKDTIAEKEENKVLPLIQEEKPMLKDIKIGELQYEEIIYTSTFNNIPSNIKCVVENSGSKPHRIAFQYWLNGGFSKVVSVTKDIEPMSRMEFELGRELSLAKEAFAIKSETKTTLEIRVYGLDGDKVPLFERSYGIRLLPPQFFNWREPEYIAAFITYQMDSIPALQREVAQKIGGIDAYQRRDTSRVEEQVKAVYEIITERKWHYLGGFATNAGQKVRYPVEIMREKSANCIEGALLFSAIIESLGIGTAIVLVNRPYGGHAYLAWKSDERLDHFDKIIETTLAFSDNPASYEQATMRGNDEFYGDKNAGYIGKIIDVKKMWNAGIVLNEVP